MSETTKPEPELLYSGVVQIHDIADPAWRTNSDDLLHVRVIRRGEEDALTIESKTDPVRAHIRLDKRQANALFRLLRNAVAAWDGREP